MFDFIKKHPVAVLAISGTVVSIGGAVAAAVCSAKATRKICYKEYVLNEQVEPKEKAKIYAKEMILPAALTVSGAALTVSAGIKGENEIGTLNKAYATLATPAVAALQKLLPEDKKEVLKDVYNKKNIPPKIIDTINGYNANPELGDILENEKHCVWSPYIKENDGYAALSYSQITIAESYLNQTLQTVGHVTVYDVIHDFLHLECYEELRNEGWFYEDMVELCLGSEGSGWISLTTEVFEIDDCDDSGIYPDGGRLKGLYLEFGAPPTEGFRARCIDRGIDTIPSKK